MSRQVEEWTVDQIDRLTAILEDVVKRLLELETLARKTKE